MAGHTCDVILDDGAARAWETSWLRRSAARAARRLQLPRGRTLPRDAWERRHRLIVALLWLHALGLAIFGVAMGLGALHSAAEALPMAVAAAAASSHRVPRRARGAVASLGLITASAVLVHFSGGFVEMHFHFFVMLAVIATYQDWMPYTLAILYVALHHGVVGALAPDAVYNHPDAIANPWKWAAIHAVFVLAASAASIANWRLHEGDRARREASEARLLEVEREARLQLETIHRVGQALSTQLDLPALVQTVTDATTEITGAAFGAFFYNLADERGQSYTLYALSGASREAFEQFPMPRNTAVFGPTFRGEGIVRLDDVRQDPRYGQSAPHHGMPPGHLPVVSYLAVPVVSRSGEVLGGLFFGHPEPGRFTERHENIVAGVATQTAIAMDNARLYQETREAVRARDEFLSIAAHELRTPVTGLKGSVQLLQRMADRGVFDQERLRSFTQTAVTSSNRLAGLIDELLDVARIRAGQLGLQIAPTDLPDLLTRVVREQCERLDGRHQIVLEVPREPCVLAADAGRLEQVFTNLLDNAVKYSPDGGAIYVSLRIEDGEACVRVRDEGIGLPPEDLETIFRPFGRAENAKSRHLPGMGLGLHICRNIVEQHQGRLWAESAGDGQGTTMVLALPGAQSG